MKKIVIGKIYNSRNKLVDEYGFLYEKENIVYLIVGMNRFKKGTLGKDELFDERFKNKYESGKKLGKKDERVLKFM